MAIDPRQGLWIDFVTGRRKLKEMSDNEKKVLYEYGLEKGHIEYDRIPETTRSVLGLKAVQKTQDTSMPSPAPAKQEDKDNTFLQAIDNVIKSLQLKAPLDIWQPQRDRVPSVGIRDIPGQLDLDKIFEPKLPPQVGVEKKQPLEIWQPMRDRAPLGGQMPKTMPQMGLTGNISLWEPMRDVPQGKERSMGTKLETGYFERGDQPSIAKTIGKSLLAGGARLSQNIANIPRMIAKGGAKLLDFLTPDKIYKEEEDPYVKFFDKVVGGYEEVTQKHIEDLGELKGVRKDLSGVMLNLPQIAFSAFMGLTTGGMSTTAKLGDVSRMLAQQSKWLSPEVARMIPFGATAGSGYAREAELEGANYLQQVLYGVLGGLGEMATEMPVVTGWINIIDKVTGGLGRAGAANLMQLYGQVGIDWLKNILAEAVQEAAMEPITAMARTLYADDVTLYGEGGIIDIKGMAEAARGGAAMSIVLGALGLPMSTAANIYVTRKIEKNEPMTEQDLINVAELIKKDLEQQEPAKTGLTEKDIMDLATEVAKPFTEPGPVTPKPAQTTVQKPPAAPKKGEISSEGQVIRKDENIGYHTGDLGKADGEIVIKPEDIDYERARRAYSNISMDPERRAISAQQDYVSTMNSIYNRLSALAKTDEQKRILTEEFKKFQQGYIQRYNALLDAKSRTASPMITGPSNFPVERNRKRMEIENRRRKELLDYGKRQPERIEKLLKSKDTEENKFNAFWQDIASSIGVIKGIDAGTEPYNRALFVSSIQGKIERAFNRGDTETAIKALKKIKEIQASMTKPVFTSRHSIWKLLEKEAIPLAEKHKPEVTEVTGEHGVARINDNDKVVLSFDKEYYMSLSDELKKEIKSNFLFSRKSSAWISRGYWRNKAYAYEKILKKHGLSLAAAKAQEQLTPEETTKQPGPINKAWKKITTLEDTLERYDIDAKEKARIIDTYKRLTEGAKQAGVNVNLIVNLADKITANITDTMLKEHGLKPGTDAYIAGKTEMHKDGEIFNIVITLLADRNAPITQEIIHEFAEVWATVWEHGKPAEYGRAIDFLVKRGLSKERAREFLPEIFTDYALNEELIGDMINEDQAAKTLFSKTLDSFKNWLQTVLKRLSYFRSQVLKKLPDEIKNQARLFANGKWKEAFESIKDVQHIDDTTRYAVRTRPAPKKTIKAYKLMRVMETQKGKVFPLFVDAAQPAPIGVWLDAEEGPITINEKTGIPKVTSRLGKLAYRPGWHLTDIPIANHIGVKGKSGKIEFMNSKHVWCECEAAADIDYQPEANANGRDPKTGRVIPSKADIKRIPVDGYYRFKTNPNMAEDWIITGAIKINRVLSDAEVEQILIEHGQKPMPRQGGPIDLKKYGLDKDQLMYSIKAEGIDPILETYQKVFGEKPVTATSEETTKQPGPTEITNIEKDGITIDEHRRAFDKNGNLIFSPKGRDRLSAEKMDAALEQFKKDYNRFEKGLTYITGKTKYIFKGVTPSGDWQFEEVDTGRMEYIPYDRLLAYDFTEAESETKPQEELKEISSGEPIAKPQEELRTVPKQVAPSETNVQPKQPSAIYRYYITMDPEIRGDAIPDAKNVVLYDKVVIDSKYSKYGKVYGFVDFERPASQDSIMKYGLIEASRPANEALLEQLIIDGELDEDNIIIPRAKYLGYTKEMKEFIAKELIDGSKTDEKYISFKVPGDGKFTVVNRPDAIARLLNSLNIKAQVDDLPANIKKAIDGETVAYCSINGITYFIPESKKAYFIAMPDKDFAAVKNYALVSQSLPAKKRITLMDRGSVMRGTIEDFLSSDMAPANGKVYVVKKFRNKKDVYLFEHNGLYYIFIKGYVDLFNEKGNKMYLSTLKTKKGDAARLMITNSEGQIIGGINSLFETITEEEVSSEDLSAIPATVKWNTKHNDPYKPSALENQTDAITGLKNDLLTTGVAHNEGRTAKITADFIDENREKRVYNIDIIEDGQHSVLLNKDIADYDEAINRAIDYLIHGKPAEKATETKKPMPEEREKPPRIKETNRLTLPVEKLAADYKARGMDKYRAWDQFIIDRALKPEIDASEFYQIFEEVSPNLIRDGFTGEIVPTHIIKHVGGREMKVMLLEEDDKKITWVEEHRMTGTSFKKDLEIFEEIKPEEPTPPSITKAEDIIEQIAPSETREAEIPVEPTMTIEESLEQGKLPKVEQTVVDNIRSGYGKYKKTVLQLSIDSKGVLVVDYAPFDRTGDTSIQHKLEHGFVLENGKIKFIGQAEEITKRVGKITGQTYDIKDWLKSLGFKWNGRTKTWEGVVKSEQKDQKVVAPITGLDYRLPLRSSEDYGRIIVTRGKRLEGTGTSDISEKTKRVLREHQIDGVNLAVAAIDKYGGFLLADGTGAGKTMQELAVAEHYSRKGNNVLIVTVNRQVINTAFKEQAKMLGLTVNEVTTKLGHGINITTYASLGKLTENPDYIIFDEAHSMKNYKISTRAKKGIALAQKAKGVLYATATPFDKAEHIKYLDRLAIFERKSFSMIMDALGYKYREKRIGRQTVGEWVRDVSLEEAEERLSNLFGELSELGLIIKREISMDKVAIEFKQVSLPSEVQTELDKIEEHYDRTVSMPGLKRALTLMAQRRFQEPYKVNAVIKLVEEELKAGKQVVVFATRIEDAEIEDAKIADDVNKMASEGTLKTLTSLLESKGIKVARIYGSGNVESQVKAFQEGKKQVALVTPQKGGAGLSLDDTVGDKPRTMIVITPPFSGVDNVQMAGRINRLNTKSNSKIVYLLADTSIDEWNKEIIVNKMKTLKAIVKGDIEKLDIESAQESSQIITDIINKNVKEVEADLKTKDQTTGILPKAVRDRINATKKRKTEVDLKGTQVTAQKNVETVLEATSAEDMPKYMDTLLGVKEGVEDIFSFEPKLKHFPKFRNAVRLFKGVSKDARDYSTKAVYSIIGNLDDGEFEVFRKIIALQDIVENGTQGLRLPMDIPLEEYEEALEHYRQYETANVKRALDKHKELMEAVAYDLVKRGKLDEESVREYYYPHRILGNERLFEAKGVPIRIKKPYRAYTKRRTGSAKLIDMDYIEVMLKHLTRVFIDNAIDDFVNEQARIYNAMPVTKEARDKLFGTKGPQPNQIYNIDGEEYVAWQYQPGNAFYIAHTLTERAILDALEEGATVKELIEDEKIKKALAVGRKHQMFLLPLEIADKLSSFRKPKEYNRLYQLAVEGVTLWKRIVLDFAGIPYQLNNIIGDAMNLYREDPIAFTKFFEAISALRGNPEFKALIEAAERQRVIDSGFYGAFTQNIDPEIASKLGLKLGPIAKYEQASTFRENILRLAKFMKDMERIQAGKKVVTKTVDIRGLSPEEAAGKVAREAIVDYQGISERMANMRQFWLPFATFYIENAKSWAKYVAKHPGNLLIKFGVPAVMLYIWNNLIQDDDDELPDYFKDQFHINTGFRTADGKLIIISLETPLDIAKNMIGLDKLDDNVKAVLGGDKNILEAARDQALYSIVAVGKRSFLLLNPVLKAGIEIAINKNVFMDSNIVPSRLEGTPEAAKMKANYFVQSLFSPYAQYVRAARDIEPESDFAKWLLKGPLDIKRALGVREVDTEAISRGKIYDSAAKAEIAYRQNQHKLEQAVIKAVVNEDKEILLKEGQKLVEKGFPVSKKDIDEILSKPRVQAEIIKQKLRKEKDKDERKKLQDMLKKAQQATLMETLKGTPKKARKDIVTKGQ